MDTIQMVRGRTLGLKAGYKKIKIKMHKATENKLEITNLKILIFIKINSHNSYNMDYHLDGL